MTDPVVESLILDLLEWISNRPERTYEEVMDAWRTSCPRLPVWEDAKDRGLVTTEYVGGRSLVNVTAAGLAHLGQRNRAMGGVTADKRGVFTAFRRRGEGWLTDTLGQFRFVVPAAGDVRLRL
jgi:hypothetical protein